MTNLRWSVGACALLACIAAQGQTVRAEFAVRWRPQDGGPATIRAVADLLTLEGKTTHYLVRYFEPDASAGPSNLVPIVRERSGADGTKPETTWKIRGGDGDSPVECPLRGAQKSKEEVDVSVLSDGSVRRAFSRSCTAAVGLETALPSVTHASRKGCDARMTRLEAKGGLTVEHWSLANGETLLEVSVKREDTREQLARFRNDVVSRLVAGHIEPLNRSKTEFVTTCS